MFLWLKRYMPRGLYGRAALILVLPVVTVQLVVSFLFIRGHLEDVTTQMTFNAVGGLNAVIERVEEAGSIAEAQIAVAPALDVFNMTLTFHDPSGMPDRDLVRWNDFSGNVVRNVIHRYLPDSIVQMQENKEIDVYLPSKFGPAEITFNRRRVTVTAPHQLIVTMVFFGLLMTVISFLYLRNQIRPITRLARAAQAFGRGRVVPYTPAGATEVRAAGGAFLDMRARIERQIEQRTQMLSGVSHDLRTPLTRMKLGLSMMDEEEAEPLLQDVDEMQRLLDAFLDFSRGAGEGEPEKVDPKSLVAKVVDDARRAGRDVTQGEMQGEGTVMLRPLAMRRAIENLLGNAVRYGTRAEVSVMMTEKSLRIRVEDDGPGIPAERREEAVKPFTRLDPSRNQNLGGGVGLGLAIVNDVARAHGGVLRLSQSERLGGLCADIVIAR